MPTPIDWDANTAVSACPVIAWESSAWRIHKRKYVATDPGGSRRVSGRYHRGTDQFAAHQAWAALYLATHPEICLAELFRHITPELFPFLNDYRLSEIALRLTAVVDCRLPERLHVPLTALTDDFDYELTQRLGKAVYERGFEGMLVPSATALGDNLILFPLNIRATSRMEIIASRDPRLRPV
jgi:RES domain-containing protein